MHAPPFSRYFALSGRRHYAIAAFSHFDDYASRSEFRHIAEYYG